ncbi:GntR family transcriptional regulator [Falsirhodobacter algicola]|uniref:FCD domain-containing protein n=1 Tax=Falsirhodobacter algicola TaxID=2692330 RepID=A0A8J8SM86_9RHOB|nr:GntR family transcriptional regulator [Falsirhodobacter algicola]QUS37199.1 FCD domain-containing protein [Falsirhodobacter algicola]
MEHTQDTDLRISHAPQTLREIAVDRLRSAIIAGRFRSGDRLVERVLGDQLGVSRTVVREAIRYLEAEGLVEIAPRIGPIVAPLDWAQARQIYAIRRLLEAEAAADCARLITPADRDRLTAAQTALEEAARRSDAARLYQASTDFYEIIFLCAGHDVAWDIVRRLNSRISRLRALTLASDERRVSGPARMARIAAAILAGDGASAAQAVHDHLTEAAQIAEALLKTDTEART